MALSAGSHKIKSPEIFQALEIHGLQESRSNKKSEFLENSVGEKGENFMWDVNVIYLRFNYL